MEVNEIKSQDGQPGAWAKFIAGALLIFFTGLSGTLVVAYWPDRLPDPKERLAPLYRYELFHIRLACIPDSPCCRQCNYLDTCGGTKAMAEQDEKKQQDKPDTAKTGVDSHAVQPPKIDTPAKPALNPDGGQTTTGGKRSYIHINTILLILVALGGFAGNMIHIATSFTTFVGDKKFEKSWLLWYFVKPFTASALALGGYFMFRAGFLNTSAEAPNINLYGVMTIAVLTGLFTDTATLKMKEVFEVIFKPKDLRTGKRDDGSKINPVTPAVIKRGTINKFTLTGIDIDKIKPLLITIGGTNIENPVVKPNELSFSFVIPLALAAATTLALLIKDDKDNVYLSEMLTVEDQAPPAH